MNRFVTNTSSFKIDWPKTPKMQAVWWEVLTAIGNGAKTTPEIIGEASSSVCADCDCPGRRVGSITKTLTKLGLISSTEIKGEKLTQYALTDFGLYCFAAYSVSEDKSQFVVSRKHNLDLTKPKRKTRNPLTANRPKKNNDVISGWINFLTRSLVPAGDIA